MSTNKNLNITFIMAYLITGSLFFSVGKSLTATGASLEEVQRVYCIHDNIRVREAYKIVIGQVERAPEKDWIRIAQSGMRTLQENEEFDTPHG